MLECQANRRVSPPDISQNNHSWRLWASALHIHRYAGETGVPCLGLAGLKVTRLCKQQRLKKASSGRHAPNDLAIARATKPAKNTVFRAIWFKIIFLNLWMDITVIKSFHPLPCQRPNYNDATGLVELACPQLGSLPTELPLISCHYDAWFTPSRNRTWSPQWGVSSRQHLHRRTRVSKSTKPRQSQLGDQPRVALLLRVFTSFVTWREQF